jgi:hypothetical protein
MVFRRARAILGAQMLDRFRRLLAYLFNMMRGPVRGRGALELAVSHFVEFADFNATATGKRRCKSNDRNRRRVDDQSSSRGLKRPPSYLAGW